MWEWLTYNFSWYGGAVWPNIWAWIVCGVPTVTVLVRRYKKRMKAHLAAHHESLIQHFEEQLRDLVDLNGRNDHADDDIKP